MTSEQVYNEWNATQEPTVYLDRHGGLHELPETRAELVRHLCFQRRLSRHLADVIIAISRSREVSR